MVYYPTDSCVISPLAFLFLDQSNTGQLWTFGYLPNPTKSDKNITLNANAKETVTLNTL